MLLGKNWNIDFFFCEPKEFEIFNYVHIIFKHINQVVNFKES